MGAVNVKSKVPETGKCGFDCPQTSTYPLLLLLARTLPLYCTYFGFPAGGEENGIECGSPGFATVPVQEAGLIRLTVPARKLAVKM